MKINKSKRKQISLRFLTQIGAGGRTRWYLTPSCLDSLSSTLARCYFYWFTSWASRFRCLRSGLIKESSPQVLILSDLECDYINAQQCCSKLNFWSIPKISAHFLVTLLLLVTGHYWLFLVNVPFIGYLMYEYQTVPRGNMGIFDPAEIHVSQWFEAFGQTGHWTRFNRSPNLRWHKEQTNWPSFFFVEPWANQKTHVFMHDLPRLLPPHLFRVSVQVSLRISTPGTGLTATFPFQLYSSFTQGRSNQETWRRRDYFGFLVNAVHPRLMVEPVWCWINSQPTRFIYCLARKWKLW